MASLTPWQEPLSCLNYWSLTRLPGEVEGAPGAGVGGVVEAGGVAMVMGVVEAGVALVSVVGVEEAMEVEGVVIEVDVGV